MSVDLHRRLRHGRRQPSHRKISAALTRQCLPTEAPCRGQAAHQTLSTGDVVVTVRRRRETSRKQSASGVQAQRTDAAGHATLRQSADRQRRTALSNDRTSRFAARHSSSNHTHDGAGRAPPSPSWSSSSVMVVSYSSARASPSRSAYDCSSHSADASRSLWNASASNSHQDLLAVAV